MADDIGRPTPPDREPDFYTTNGVPVYLPVDPEERQRSLRLCGIAFWTMVQAVVNGRDAEEAEADTRR